MRDRKTDGRKDGRTPATDVSEERFLERPAGRTRGTMQAVRVFIEMIKGMRALRTVGPSITVFGSARLGEESPYYQMARTVGSELAKVGFTVITGSGPGIMEAANRGARESGGRSVGCGINLRRQERPNDYLDTFVEFKYFFVRKLMLVKYSFGFVALPGGFGTMDEVFETATLIQTGKIKNFPMILMGRDYWKPILEFLQSKMVTEGTIEQHDLDRLIVTDDPLEAAQSVRQAALDKFGVRYLPAPKQ